MSDAPNSNLFDQIQSLCRDYRRQLKQGSQESIETYLNRIDESGRENLFQNLLHIDIEFRRRKQEAPSSDEYISRFPSYSKLVRQAFFESTMMSQVFEETPAEQETILFGLPPARKIGEYEILKELGRGGFGVVYEAKHLQRQDRVALKTLPTSFDGQTHPLNDAERLHKFRREFRSLSEINHPNLVGMQTLEVDGNQWFFTMDLVDGVDFLEYVRPHNRLNEVRLRNVLNQLVKGILALHQRGIVHRDLKPNNVLVNAEGQITILDFGLVAELQQNAQHTVSMKSRQFAGTPRYAAPEQISGTRLPASDWYALGVLLYEALTGKVPFEGGHVEVMLKKQSEAAPVLSGNGAYPVDLADLVDQLLQRDPDERPSRSAIQKMLGISDDSISHDSSDSSLQLTQGQAGHFLIGRESQLATLEQSFSRLQRTGESAVAMIRGRSGEGKSSLADKFLDPLRLRDDVLVLAGRCYDRESVPFKAIDTLIDALVAYLRPRSSDEVHGWLPDDIQMLAHLFPVLRRVEAVVDRSTRDIRGIDSRQIRYRAFNAFRELLTTMGQTTPIVLFVDDLQWGDADSAAALYDVLTPPDSPKVLLLGSYRSDEADKSPFLTEWKHKNPLETPSLSETLIEVAPLTEDQCVQLIATRIGIDREQMQQKVANLYKETQGNPYFLEQLIEDFDAETGQFQAVPLEKIIDRKLQRLPSEAAALLDVIAVAGQASPVEEIAKVTQSASQAFSTLTHMRSERLIRLIGSSGLQQVDTYHDKIRETVLASMEPSKRRSLHIQYGEYLEEVENLSADKMLASLDHDLAIEDGELPTSDRIFDLAYHFHEAQDDRAFAYQLMAGELSYRAYASDDAVEFLQRSAENLQNEASDQLRYRLRQRLGTSWLRLGRFEWGKMELENSLHLAQNEIQRALVLHILGEMNMRESKFDAALSYLDNALEELSYRRPKRLPVLCLHVMYFTVLAHFSWLQNKGRTDHERRRAHHASKIYEIVAWTEVITARPLRFMHAAVACISNAYRSGRPETIAQSLTWLAWATSCFSLHFLARWYVARAMRFAHQSDRPIEQAITESYAAAAKYCFGQLDEAERMCKAAIDQLQVLGQSGIHRSMASHFRRHIHFVQGDSRQELEAAQDELKLAQSVADLELTCWAQYGVASALSRMGKFREASSLMKTSLSGYEGRGTLVSEAVAYQNQGWLDMQSSNYEAATISFTTSWELIWKYLFFSEYAVRTLPSLIESSLGTEWINSHADKNVQQSRTLVFTTRFFAWRFPTIHSYTLRVFGRLAMVRGKNRKAIRYFERSVQSARTIGAQYDLARSLLDLAAVKEEGREENRREAIELLKKMESVIPYAERWLLGDQYDPAVVAPTLESVSETPISLETKQVD